MLNLSFACDNVRNFVTLPTASLKTIKYHFQTFLLSYPMSQTFTFLFIKYYILWKSNVILNYRIRN